MNKQHYLIGILMATSAIVTASSIDPQIQKEQRKQEKYKTFNAVTHDMASYGISQYDADAVVRLANNLSEHFRKNGSKWPLVSAQQKLASWQKQLKSALNSLNVDAHRDIVGAARYYDKAKELHAMVTEMLTYIESLSEYASQLQQYNNYLKQQQEQFLQQQFEQQLEAARQAEARERWEREEQERREHERMEREQQVRREQQQREEAAQRERMQREEQARREQQVKQKPAQNNTTEEGLNRLQKAMFDQFDPANGY